jgi:hypothetical protein
MHLFQAHALTARKALENGTYYGSVHCYTCIRNHRPKGQKHENCDCMHQSAHRWKDEWRLASTKNNINWIEHPNSTQISDFIFWLRVIRPTVYHTASCIIIIMDEHLNVGLISLDQRAIILRSNSNKTCVYRSHAIKIASQLIQFSCQWGACCRYDVDLIDFARFVKLCPDDSRPNFIITIIMKIEV